MEKGNQKIWTIGYEGTTIEDFIASLKAAGVTLLIDVRSKAFSWNKAFSGKFLKEHLREGGISYSHNPALGGKLGSRGPDWDASMHRLVDLVGSDTGIKPAVMCMEHDPANCHRGKWITPDLEAQGVVVEHLLPKFTPRKRKDQLLSLWF